MLLAHNETVGHEEGNYLVKDVAPTIRVAYMALEPLYSGLYVGSGRWEGVVDAPGVVDRMDTDAGSPVCLDDGPIAKVNRAMDKRTTGSPRNEAV